MAQVSKLTAAMAEAIANLQDKLGTQASAGQIADQVHAIIDPELTKLKDAIKTFQDNETKDEAAIADLTDAVTLFTTSLAPATAPNPEPTAEPVAPGPTAVAGDTTGAGSSGDTGAAA